MLSLRKNLLLLDVAEPWQKHFQDGASDLLFKIRILRDQVMFYMILTLGIICWILIKVTINFNNKKKLISHKYSNHGSLIETIWTIVPILILVLIAFPSFKLLYLTDDILNPQITLKIVGRQWFWTYQYSDYSINSEETISFDSYMINSNDLSKGDFRLLEVDNKIVLPTGARVRIVVSSGDVIHCWTIPSLGVKIDAVPGRLNQSSFIINRTGLFFGACSEICGAQHGYMPISLQSVKLENYIGWVNSHFE
jgi:cytochrome c oxidase subunit 2